MLGANHEIQRFVVYLNLILLNIFGFHTADCTKQTIWRHFLIKFHQGVLAFSETLMNPVAPLITVYASKLTHLERL